MAFSRVALFTAVLAIARCAAAQGTNATCLPEYSWMDNSRGQSPCLMTAYLNSACLADPTNAYVYSLPEDFHYRPPTSQNANQCQCSTVFYSMISACGTCQNRMNLPWSSWEANCSTVYTSVWPVKIPAGTSIPAWAFLDVVTPDSLNVTAAEAVAAQHAPESSAAPSPTASGTSAGTSPSATGADDPTNSPDSGSSNSGSSKKSNVGPIVGGVVGGVGGAAILAGLIAFFVIRHRRKSQSAPSAAFMPASTTGDYNTPQSPAPYNGEKLYDPSTPYNAPTFSSGSPPPPSTTVNGSSMPLYDPNDPSTFPSAAAPASFGTSGYQPSQYNAAGAPYQQHQTGKYSGAPEV